MMATEVKDVRNAIMHDIKALEIERIKYMLKLYFRERNAKVYREIMVDRKTDILYRRERSESTTR